MSSRTEAGERGYGFIAPLDANGHIALGAWKELKERCRVRRFWAHEAEEVGHLIHKSGGVWAFHYDIHADPSHDESGFRFERRLRPRRVRLDQGEDDVMRTFRCQHCLLGPACHRDDSLAYVVQLQCPVGAPR